MSRTRMFGIVLLCLLIAFILCYTAFLSPSPGALISASPPSSLPTKEAHLTEESDLPPVRQSYPAPAKKLHQLINDDNLAQNTGKLESQFKSLEGGLASIRDRFPPGVLPNPPQPNAKVSHDDDLNSRISQMRKHIEEKQSLENKKWFYFRRK